MKKFLQSVKRKLIGILVKIFVVTVCISALNGCATTYRQYSGPPLDVSKIAVLYQGTYANIGPIDGKRRSNVFAERYEVLPGYHTVVAEYVKAGVEANFITLAFIAQAGHVYMLEAKQLHPAIWYQQEKWTAAIFDLKTQQRIDISV